MAGRAEGSIGACSSGSQRTGRMTASLALATWVAPSAVAKKAPQGPGCDSDRPAVAHYSGGVPAPGRRSSAPVPCETFVGTTSEAASSRRDPDGTGLAMRPCSRTPSTRPRTRFRGRSGVGCSQDLGASWTRLDSGGPTTGGLVPPRRASIPRLLGSGSPLRRQVYAALGSPGATTTGMPGRPGRGPLSLQGGEKLLEGRPSGSEQDRWAIHTSSTTAPTRSTSPRATCGATSDRRRPDLRLHRRLLRPPAAARLHGATPPRAPGVVGSDGVLYFPTTLCGTLGVAISRDEGVPAAGSSAPMSRPAWRTSTTTGTAGRPR